MNMKKLFTMLIVSAFCTMAYAATATTISVKSVTIPKGGTAQLEVTVNNATNNTAFQFDLTLPAGVSVESVTMNNGAIVGKKVTEAEDTNARKLKYGVRDANANKYRFLSYDNNNAKLTDGKVVITLAATEEAETGTIAGSEILVVNDEGGKTEQGNGDVASITVADGVSITIGSTGKSTLVSGMDLDFSDVAVKAYIASGYDKTHNTIWLTRVKDVPAGTPIMLMGEPSGDSPYIVPSKPSHTYYPVNYLKGNADASVTVDQSGDYLNMALMGGKFGPINDATFPKGRCYLQLPTVIASNTGAAFSFTMGKTGKKSYIGKVDLDFTSVEGLAAYTVTGYDKNGTIWLTSVKKVSAGTPLYLIGTANQPYEVPSVAVESSYINMLKGDADNNIAITTTKDGFTNCVLQGGKFSPLANDEPNFPAGNCYLPIPSSYLVAASRGEVIGNSLLEAEVMCISLSSIEGENATGISRVAAEAAGNDAWYNLSGQRISAPTKKGLYIKNGKKIVVK